MLISAEINKCMHVSNVFVLIIIPDLNYDNDECLLIHTSMANAQNNELIKCFKYLVHFCLYIYTYIITSMLICIVYAYCVIV